MKNMNTYSNFKELSRMDMKLIFGGTDPINGVGLACGSTCTTWLECGDGEVCISCPAGTPGKGCERRS